MFEYEIDKIRSILIDVLGQPKNEPYSSGWQSFCCPYCAANEGVESDGKYNLLEMRNKWKIIKIDKRFW